MRHNIGRFSDLAWFAMIAEVYTTPKPGLVDAVSSGAHQDMSLSTFLASADAIRPYLLQIEQASLQNVRLPGDQLLTILRPIGAQAEQAMFSATGGVNTHKGAIFILGLLCAACARCQGRGIPLSPRHITNFVRSFTSGTVERELAPLASSQAIHTSGERLYLRYGTTGIRGEAQKGFPSVLLIGLPAFRRGLVNGLSYNDAAIHALLSLMVRVEDTNLLARGGQDGLRFAREQSRHVLARGGMTTPAGRNAIKKMQASFFKRNLSPGGCADLLAASIFLERISTKS